MGSLVTVYRALFFVLALLSLFVNAQDPTSTTTTDIVPPPLSDTNLFTSTTSTDLTTDLGSATLTDVSSTSTDSSSLSLPTDSSTSSIDISTITDSFTSSPASTTDPSSSTGVIPPPVNPPQPPSPSSHSNAGAIAGGVVGGLAGLAVIAGLIFLYLRHRRSSDYRGRSGRSGSAIPPSPRLKSPWLGGIGLGGGGTGSKKQPRAQRLGSVGGESKQTSPPRSNDDHGTTLATSDDAHELGESGFGYRNASGSIRNGVTAGAVAGAAASGSMGRHRSSLSRTSAGGEDTRGNSRSSYDLSVFHSASNVGASRGHSQQADPSSSETSIGAGANSSGVSDLSRGLSTTRLTRKPAPRYDDGSEPSSPVSPRQSKPPVSGPPRTRTYSNSSSMRAQAAANSSTAGGGSSSRSSLEAPQLAHKGSQGTLGGAFKFAGEKEGPVHYLIPDPPAPPA